MTNTELRKDFMKWVGAKNPDKHDERAYYYAAKYAGNKSMTPRDIVSEIFADPELSEMERLWICFKMGEFNMRGGLNINDKHFSL